MIVFSELVSAFGVAGVTLHYGGRDGAFDFSGEVSFSQWRDSHPDRSNSVSSMVYGSDAGSWDFDGLEFGLSVAGRNNRGASCLACFLDRHSSL